MRTTLLACVLAAVCLNAGAAAAQDGSNGPDHQRRWYVAFDAGYHWPQTVDSHSTGAAPDGAPYDWRWRTNDSWAINGRIGYHFTPHVRAEFETGYDHSGLNSVQASPGRPGEPLGLCASLTPTCVPPGRSHGSWTWMFTAMGNAIVDFAPDSPVDPFVGVGVGLAHIQWPNTYFFSNNPGVISSSNPAQQTLRDAGTLTRLGELAVQFKGGVAYRLTPRTHLDLTYRYYTTTGDLRWNPLNTTPGVTKASGLQPGDFLGRFGDQSVTVGMSYAF